ncbi:MAG: DUF805 domain-containing protein [Oceanicaulis sp.]
MSFVDAIKSVYSNYVNFQGRARRSEYWWFYLFYVLVVIALSIVSAAVNESLGSLLTGIFVLGTFIPLLAAGVRRLHDTGRSGWWILIALVPLVGVIVLIIFFVGDSEAGPNKYGPNPKGGGAAPEAA